MMRPKTLSQYLKKRGVRIGANAVAKKLGMHRVTLYRKFQNFEEFENELKDQIGQFAHVELSANPVTQGSVANSDLV